MYGILCDAAGVTQAGAGIDIGLTVLVIGLIISLFGFHGSKADKRDVESMKTDMKSEIMAVKSINDETTKRLEQRVDATQKFLDEKGKRIDETHERIEYLYRLQINKNN